MGLFDFSIQKSISEQLLANILLNMTLTFNGLYTIAILLLMSIVKSWDLGLDIKFFVCKV